MTGLIKKAAEVMWRASGIDNNKKWIAGTVEKEKKILAQKLKEKKENQESVSNTQNNERGKKNAFRKVKQAISKELETFSICSSRR